MTSRASLRVAMVCLAAPGGSGAVATALAHGLAVRGHRVHVVAPARPFRWEPCSRLTLHVAAAPTVAALPASPWESALASCLLELAPEVDVIHAHYAVPHAAAAWIVSRLRGTPYVVTLHGTDVTRAGVDPALRPLTREALLGAAALSAPSHHLAASARAAFGLPTPPDVLPNFVDLSRFRPPDARDRGRLDPAFAPETAGMPTLVHVSNCRPVKRVVDVVSVAAAVPGARLLVVGDGPDRAAAEAHAHALGISARVAFVGDAPGWLPHLGHGDVYLSPSAEESFGLAALEAMAAGLPVVGTRVPGFDEVVRSPAGSLHPVGDVAAMAAAVRTLLGDAASHEQARRAARDVASAYAEDAVVPHYEAMLLRAAGAPAA